jgi:hypothetical protein
MAWLLPYKVAEGSFPSVAQNADDQEKASCRFNRDPEP